jgi:hypothetical protein
MSVNDLMISLDRAQLAQVESLLAHIKNGATRAISSAVNRTATTAAASTRRRLSPLMGLKLKDLKGRVRVVKPAKTVAILRILDFNVKATARKKRPEQSEGFAFSTKGDVFATMPANLFKQVMPGSGHEGYFVRSRFDEAEKTRRLPIQELHIPSPRKQWEAAPSVANEELQKARAGLHANVMSQVDRLLNRRKVDR